MRITRARAELVRVSPHLGPRSPTVGPLATSPIGPSELGRSTSTSRHDAIRQHYLDHSLASTSARPSHESCRALYCPRTRGPAPTKAPHSYPITSIIPHVPHVTEPPSRPSGTMPELAPRPRLSPRSSVIRTLASRSETCPVLAQDRQWVHLQSSAGPSSYSTSLIRSCIVSSSINLTSSSPIRTI